MGGATNKQPAWQQLAVRTADGHLVRGPFVLAGDGVAVGKWRRVHTNRDVYSTVCRFDKPCLSSAYQCDFFLRLRAGELQSVLNDTRALCSLLGERWRMPPECIDVYFGGCEDFDVLVSLAVFGNPEGGPATGLWEDLARRLVKEGIRHIDLTVYQPHHLLRLPNSINSNSGLYKVPVEAKELALGLDHISELAGQPRPFMSAAEPVECPSAMAWYHKAVAWRQQRQTRQRLRPQLRRLPDPDRSGRLANPVARSR